MGKIYSLNIARGVAAFVVAIDHFVIVAAKAQENVTGWAYYWASFAGSYAVALFFLISGFVISSSLLKQSVPEFAIRRVFRLYPVFAVCCTLKLIIALMIIRQLPTAENITNLLLNISMFGNLVLWNEQNIEPIVWTLCVEVKFYLICMLIFVLARRVPSAVYSLCIAALMTMASISYVYPPADKPWLSDIGVGLTVVPFLFNGVFAFLYYNGHIGRKKLLAGLAIANMTVMFGPYPSYFSLDKGAPSWALAGATFLLLLLFRDHKMFSSKRASDLLGGISYPLYAIHLTVLLAVDHLPISTPVKFAVYLPGFLVAAWLIHKFIERPINRIPSKILATKISPPTAIA